ncbi:Fc.00g080260.m01.CDS01 [Cosmosporella sp. VM-42]
MLPNGAEPIISKSSANSNKPKATALKKVSESVRERETFKYDPSLLTAAQRNNGPGSKSSVDLFTSSDTILTALAQLGTCQTGTSRSLISLFDSDAQYIIAEATPSLPLVPNLSHEGRSGEELWLCGTAIPRNHGICEYTLCDASIEPQGPGTGGHLPLVLVPDLTSDDRFSCKPYCRPGSPARFYAAVPIRSRRGINIGVYCVIDSEPARPWDDKKTEQMSNISKSIMDYLEARRSMANHKRSVRMNRGLGSFMEGKATVSGWRFGPSPTAFADFKAQEGMLNEHQQTLQRNEDDSVDQLVVGASVGQWFRPSAPSTGAGTPNQDGLNPGCGHVQAEPNSSNRSKTAPETVQGIFSKAANIIRESIEVEGCLFLDATVRSFGGLGATISIDHQRQGSQPSSEPSSSSDDNNLPSVNEEALHHCEALGFSTSSTSSIDGAKASNLHASMVEKFLSNLLRRYPKGKIFNFDINGDLQSSDSSEDDRRSSHFKAPAIDADGTSGLDQNATSPSKRRNKPWPRHREGSTILQTFPGARSVAFVPVWDSKRERWCAGGFVYTYSPNRIFTVEGELSYLRAFGMLAMAETSALETKISNKAKSDVLGSISHELRSPLHGVILGVELLHDTELSVFQGNIVHTIETCGRTLMDTLDHLLDFAKLNNYMKKSKAGGHTGSLTRGMRQTRISSIESGMKSLSSNVEIDRLAEEVIESVFAGFNFQHASVAQFQRDRTTFEYADTIANRTLDSMYAMEELGPRLAAGDLQINLGRVSLFLDIDPSCSWSFHTQAGAIRRILMNLFANALKYTDQGSIRVCLRQAASTRRTRLKEQMVNISVMDTGKGIGDDYLCNDLYKPFQQEDQLSPGTGLGLSIVKKITSQLNGRISVESQIGVGTTVSVSLPMVQPLPSSPLGSASTLVDDSDFKQQVTELTGLRVRLMGFDDRDQRNGTQKNCGLAESVCRDWLHLEVISNSPNSTAQNAAELLLVFEDAMPEVQKPSPSSPPTVVVCSNALVAHQLAMASKAENPNGIIEFISQPIGPRKLAKILLIAFKRWIDFQTQLELSPSFEWKDPLQPKVQSAPGSVPMDGDLRIDTNSSGEGMPSSQTTDSGFGMSPTSTSSQDNLDTPLDACQFLLVDDNHINIRVLSTYVKKLGHQYSTASNGQEALAAYSANPSIYSCIFMDISMPVMDGFEATQRIRAYEREKNLPPTIIFALSGLASNDAQQQAFSSGIDLFLSKPVTLKELGSILRSKGLV